MQIIHGMIQDITSRYIANKRQVLKVWSCKPTVDAVGLPGQETAAMDATCIPNFELAPHQAHVL